MRKQHDARDRSRSRTAVPKTFAMVDGRWARGDNDDQNNNPRRRARTADGAVQSAERVCAVTNAVWLSIFTLTWLIGLTFIFKF
jgi:hypothetical protein